MRERTHRLLSADTARDASEAFSNLHAQYKESFFSYALLCIPGQALWWAAANSEESHAERLRRAGVSPGTHSEVVYRWHPTDWKHDGLLGNGPDFHADLEDLRDTFECLDEWQDFLVSALTTALMLLTNSGFFGSGDELDDITLFVWIVDDEDTLRVVNESAAKLNSPVSAAAFADRYAPVEAAREDVQRRRREREEAVKRLPPVQQVDFLVNHALRVPVDVLGSWDEAKAVGKCLAALAPLSVVPMLRLLLTLLERRPAVRQAPADSFIQALLYEIPHDVRVEGAELELNKLFFSYRRIEPLTGLAYYGVVGEALRANYPGYPAIQYGELGSVLNGDTFEAAVRWRMENEE